MHLPSYIICTHSKAKSLRVAYDLLLRMQSSHLQPPDELCYRIMLHLCSTYNQPVLAVKLLLEMRNNNVTPNAITYGFYNRAVLESKWPTSALNAFQLWMKLKNTIRAISYFRLALKSRRSVVASRDVMSTTESDDVSRTSTDSYLDDVIPLQDRSECLVGAVQGSAAVSSKTSLTVESPNDERFSTGETRHVHSDEKGARSFS